MPDIANFMDNPLVRGIAGAGLGYAAASRVPGAAQAMGRFRRYNRQSPQNMSGVSGAVNSAPMGTTPSFDSESMDDRPPFGMQEPSDLMGPQAHGSIISKPTRVLVGDDGPEAIVPLNPNAQSHVQPGVMFRRYGR